MEIIRMESTSKLLIEITTFAGRYLRMKMKMTMTLKESQTNKFSLIYITYVFPKFSKRFILNKL
jgi:hypothetical protein